MVVHCDWSKKPGKRWMAIASRKGQRWKVEEPELVGPTSKLFDRLSRRSPQSGCLLVGFDFPLGLPHQYGEKTGLTNFRTAVKEFGKGKWAKWFDVCEEKAQISLFRPFYPFRTGGTKQEYLWEALGFTSMESILRQCEREAGACSLFWTLGGNQVGKAAISGWREVIVPNLDKIGLWPFDGGLAELVAKYDVVVVETYPGDVYTRLEIPRQPGKTKQEGRKSVADKLLKWLRTNSVEASGDLIEALNSGFTNDDQFDAVIGLFGMLDVVEDRQPEGNPAGSNVWEGWILGQAKE